VEILSEVKLDWNLHVILQQMMRFVEIQGLLASIEINRPFQAFNRLEGWAS
jgi:hypothetical protein